MKTKLPRINLNTCSCQEAIEWAKTIVELPKKSKTAEGKAKAILIQELQDLANFPYRMRRCIRRAKDTISGAVVMEKLDMFTPKESQIAAKTRKVNVKAANLLGFQPAEVGNKRFFLKRG